jgi:hypothetical protein
MTASNFRLFNRLLTVNALSQLSARIASGFRDSVIKRTADASPQNTNAVPAGAGSAIFVIANSNSGRVHYTVEAGRFPRSLRNFAGSSF